MNEEFSLISPTTESIRQIKKLNQPFYKNILSLKIVNSDYLTKMDGIEKFVKLVDLNLSSNMIQQIKHLSPLRLLKRLDLSANRIRVISGLKGLYNLEYLNLSGNKIVSLVNLAVLAGQGFKLKILDLSGNNLRDLKELKVLDKLVNLQKVTFHNNQEDSNPFCRNRIEYLRALLKLRCIDRIEVDGMGVERMIDEEQGKVMRGPDDEVDYSETNFNLNQDQRNQAEKVDTLRQQAEQMLERDRKKKAEQQKQKTVQKKGRKETNMSLSESIEENQKFLYDSQMNQSSVRNRDKRLFQLQDDLRMLEKANQQIRFKMETNERYWINKVRNLEESYKGIADKLELARKDVHVAEKNLVVLNEENKRLKEITKNLTRIQEIKEESESKHQAQVSELMRTNGDLFRQCQVGKEKIDDLTKSNTKLNAQITELRRLVKDYENNIQKLHDTSLKSNEMAIQRYEELVAKHKELQRVCDTQENQLGMLNDEKNQMYKENVNWSSLLKEKLREQKEIENERVEIIKVEAKEREDHMTQEFQKILEEKEKKFNHNLDMLEQEFKKVLVDATNKTKAAKGIIQDLKSEKKELKTALEISISKNQEQEELISEMNETLLLARNEIKEVREGDTTQQLTTLVEKLERDLEDLKIENKKLQRKVSESQNRDESTIKELEAKEKDISLLKRENYSLNLQLEEQADFVKRIEQKFKNLESNNIEEINELQEKYRELNDESSVTKTIIKDKTAQIEELKVDLSAKESELERQYRVQDDLKRGYEDKILLLEEEQEKLLKKADKSKMLMDDYETKIDEQYEKIEELRTQKKALKESILAKSKVMDQCLVQIQELKKEKIDRENEDINRIDELEEYKVEYEAAIENKDARIGELESGLNELKRAYEGRIRSLEAEKGALQEDNFVKEEEIKTLIFEIEKQKKMAKKNLKKLTQMFS